MGLLKLFRALGLGGGLSLGAAAAEAQLASDPAAPFLGCTIDQESLQGLPSSREAWSLLRTMEATVVADRIEAGGLFAGTPALLGVHGASWTDTAWQLGEIEITDPDRGGTPLLAPPAEALGSVSLVHSFGARSAGGAGPQVLLAPRLPDTTWHGALDVHAAPQVSEGGGVAPSIARLSSWNDVSLTAGGPVRADRLALFGAARGTSTDRRERGQATDLHTGLRALFTHAVFTPAPGYEWHFLAAGATVDREANEAQRTLHLQASFARHADPAETSWTVAAGFQHDHETPGDAAGSGVAAVERLQDGPVSELLVPERRIRRWDAVATASPAFLRFGQDRNRPTVRLSLERSSAEWIPVPGAFSGQFAELVGGLPARVWDYDLGAAFDARATHVSLALDDRVELQRTLRLMGGVRLDAWRAQGEGGGGRIEWTTVSPRIGARWRPVTFATVFGGWERLHPRLPLRYLQWGAPDAPQGSVYRWNDDGDLRYEADERGALVSRVGPGAPVGALDAGLRSPRTDGIVAGLDLRPGARWLIRFAGIRRHARSLVESVNVGVGTDGYRTVLVPDPAIDFVGPADDRLLPIFVRDPKSFGADRYLLTNVPEHDVLHEGVELFVEGRPWQSLFLRVGGTASRSTGQGGNRGFGVLENDPGLIGELFDSPNADTYSRGRLFFDRAYTLKIAALWRPGDWSLGAVANYQDGQPFARVVLARDLPQGPEAISAIRRGDHRFTYTVTLDARLERAFAVHGTRVALSVEAFNLLDMKNEVEEDVVYGPAFRTVTAVQPPRALRVGLRLSR